MTSALLDACRPKFDAFIGPQQMAFTKGHSTMDCIFAMEANTEKVLIGDWDCYMALLRIYEPYFGHCLQRQACRGVPRSSGKREDHSNHASFWKHTGQSKDQQS